MVSIHHILLLIYHDMVFMNWLFIPIYTFFPFFSCLEILSCYISYETIYFVLRISLSISVINIITTLLLLLLWFMQRLTLFYFLLIVLQIPLSIKYNELAILIHKLFQWLCLLLVLFILLPNVLFDSLLSNLVCIIIGINE